MVILGFGTCCLSLSLDQSKGMCCVPFKTEMLTQILPILDIFPPWIFGRRYVVITVLRIVHTSAYKYASPPIAAVSGTDSSNALMYNKCVAG